MSVPKVDFNPLPHADGSSSYVWQGYHIVGAVNGPIEPQRRDELTEEAFIEVNIRQASGAGGTRERYLEALVHSTLRSIVLTYLYPRTLLQLTLQILATPESQDSAAPIPQSASHLLALPHLLHTALLSLIAANIPLSNTFSATLCTVSAGIYKVNTVPSESESTSSIHVFVVSSGGETLLVESEGQFAIEEIHIAGRAAEDSTRTLNSWLRKTITDQVQDSARWRGGSLIHD